MDVWVATQVGIGCGEEDVVLETWEAVESEESWDVEVVEVVGRFAITNCPRFSLSSELVMCHSLSYKTGAQFGRMCRYLNTQHLSEQNCRKVCKTSLLEWSHRR